MLKSSSSVINVRLWRVRLTMCIMLLGSFASCALPSSEQPAATNSYITEAVPTILYTAAASPVSATLTPSSMPKSPSVTRIRTPGETDGREVLTAFWSQDGSKIYYALVNEVADTPLWFEILLDNVQSYPNKQLASPPALAYTPFIPVGGVYLEYQGLVSPSGRYRFQITQADQHLLHLQDSIEQSTVDLLEMPDLNFRGAYWIPDESSVVFSVGPEYGTLLYRYNIRAHQLQSFEELVGFSDPNVSEWALSPDGKHVAILDGNESLKLFSIDGSFSTTLPGYSNHMRWAGNSQMFCYYSGTQLYDPTSIGCFDMSRKVATDMMQLSELERLGVNIGFFDVSPDGSQLVFWQAGEIWLVSFH